MENDRLIDLNELHNLANITFQNVTNLAPALRQIVVSAKAYQKSVHNTCNLAVNFIDTLSNIAKAASVSEGATKKIGDVLLDIIETFKEIENMKLELTKLFINEVIIPLESRAEIQIGNMKGTHKSYNLENKFQTELYEKAQSSYAKISRKSDRKTKRSPKLEAKVKENARTLDIEEAKLKKTREEGLRKALIEERRVYCFVTERMCAYGRGTVVYNNRISNFVNQKIPDWSQFIAKPTELPPESEAIIQNPTGYKMGTVKRKVSKTDKRESLKRGKSLPNHYHTKYNTIDSRSSSRAGSRPSLSGVSTRSEYEGTCTPGSATAPMNASTTPNRSPNLSPKIPRCNSIPASPRVKTMANHNHVSSASVPNKMNESVSVESSIHIKEALTQNEEAIAATIVASNNALKVEANPSPISNSPIKPSSPYSQRSHSFSVQGKKAHDEEFRLNRTGSTTSSSRASAKAAKKLSGTGSHHSKQSSVSSDAASEFTQRLSMIQSELHKQFVVTQSTDPAERTYLKALYDHSAQDASQLSFKKGDLIVPTCEPTSGWQYGEHELSKKAGWFPASYTVSYSTDRRKESHDTTSSMESSDSLRSSESGTKKAPPPVAKKSFKSPSHKVTGGTGGTGGTLPTKKKSPRAHTIIGDQNVHADDGSPLPSSSSMPNVTQAVGGEQTVVTPNQQVSTTENVQVQGEELSIAVQKEDSFDTTDEETNPGPAVLQKGFESSGSVDSLPPPPPPPPLSDDEDDDPQ